MTMNNRNARFLNYCLIIIIFIFSSTSFATTEQIRVSSNNDDAEELISDGDMYRNSSDLELGYDSYAGGLQIVGIRFRNINIPQGATITSAYIEFETDETDSGTTNLVIFGEDDDSAKQFNNSDYNISDDRTKTSAYVNWSPSSWNSTNELHQTPDISTIIQEIVNRSGWTANNNLVIIVEPGSGCTTSSCQRTAESHEGESNAAPLLVVEYTTGSNKLSVTTENVIQEYDVSSYGGNQDQSGTVEIRDAGLSLYLDGNRWQKIDLPYTVTADTVIEFDFQSTDEGEIHGLGFDNDLQISSDKSFHVYGSQNWGLTNFGSDPYAGTGTTHFKISVGQFYTGDFQYLFFINDDDSNPTGNGLFSNIVIYEDDGCPAINGSGTNVSDIASYTQIYQLDIPDNADYDSNTPVYGVDNSATSMPDGIDRIGYYMELQENDSCDTKWVWVSIDAFTQDLSQIGVPVSSTGAIWQQLVDNMNVESNVVGVDTGTGITSGNIEFWHNCYGTNNQAGVTGADDDAYDYGDALSGASCYGSMQVHNYGTGETILAWNAWDWSSGDDIGIGSQSSGEPDWTFASNTSDYSIRNLEVWVKPTDNSIPIAEYHFDETSWDGTGQVADNSSNALNGTAVGDANTTIINGGQVCRAGSFDGNGDYIDVSGIDSYLNTTASLSFWINTSQIGNNTSWDAPGITGVEQSGGGNDIFWGYIDSSGHIRIMKGNGTFAVSSNPINTGNWHHVVLTWDSSLGTVQVFVDGDFNNSATSETGDVSTTFSKVGQIKNNGLSFNGQLDELLIFDSVISPGLVNSIYNNQVSGEKNYDGSARICPEPDVHHYEIVHDSQGLTCDDETVTVKACSNESCSTLSTESTTLEFLANSTILSTPTFTGSTSINFNNTTVETLTFSVANASISATDPLVCDDGTGSSCDMAFANAGFRFLYGTGNSTILPNQTSGSVFGDTLKIQAVKDTNGVCTGLFTNNKDINLSQENVDPSGSDGLSFTVNGSDIAKHTSFTSTSLYFDADSIATIPTPIYHDAGEIRLHADYDLAGVSLSGSSNSFWVSPAELVINAKSGATELNGASATSTTTFVAGDDFNLTVTAYNSLGVITPNYSPGQIQLKLERTGPTTNGVDGELTYGSGGFITSALGSVTPIFGNVTLDSTSISGVFGSSAAQYSDVGLLNLDVQDNNYGNANIVLSATAIDIGRFIPDHFRQTMSVNGSFKVALNTGATFVYSGQKDEATGLIGAITYDIPPVLDITAYNIQGEMAQNYIGDFAKLQNAKTSSDTLDGVFFDLVSTTHDNTLEVTGDISTVGDYGEGSEYGSVTYTLASDHHFTYTRSSLSVVSPFDSALELPITSIRDSDNVQLKPEDSTVYFANPTFSSDLSNTVEVRFGRLVLENSFGSETSDLAQPMQLEHFDGADFIVTSDNDYVSFDTTNISLENISLDPALTDVLGGSGNFFSGKTRDIELKAPGTQGQIGVTYDIYDWLEYDWPTSGTGDQTFDDDPTADATFGVFRGNDRIISWREVGN